MNAVKWSDEGRKELFASYIKAQGELGPVFKNANNPAFKSKYADLATVIEAVVPVFNKNDMAVIQSPTFDGEAVAVETIIAHSGGGYMRSTLALRPTKTDPQGIGSATTYARRYALLALAGVAPEDDDGNAASGPGQTGQRFQRGEPMGAHNMPKDFPGDRKSSAQAKRDGDSERIKAIIQGFKDERALDEWFVDFRATEMRALPLAWEDAISDMVESRRNELLDEMAAA